ncbi:MAG: ATP-binding cassette domain-containing protein [Bacteroidetes bacterium]|nr:ATP-binding cassette domain-containing protein [Bacteroidota bacterium]
MSEKKNKTGDVLDLKLLGRIVKLAAPFRKHAIFAVVTTIALAVISPLQPILIQRTLDVQVASGDLKGLGDMLLLLIGLLLLQTVVMFLNTYVTNWLGQEVIHSLRMKVYKHLMSLKVKYYDKTPIGTLVTRSVSDIETVANIFSQGVITITGDFLQIFVISFLMFYTDWKLSLICLSVLPFLFWASNNFRKGVKVAFQQVRTAVAKLNAFVQEHITGMRVVQIFNRENREYEKFVEINKLHRDANIKSVYHYAIFFPIVEIITATSIGLLVWYGAKNSLQGLTSPGEIVAFILYLNMFFRPIRMIADRFNTMQMGMVASERIFDLIDEKDFIETDGNHSGNLNGNVEFRDVHFSYTEGEEIIKGISFDVPAGKTLAIVGATGSGKSTIVNLLTHFYQINKGEILIDGKNINDWNLKSLRSQIAFVLQDVFLFSGSVKENIKLMNESISDEEMMEAAEYIGAANFISRLEGEYDYPVMERGGALSVGQRQLISFVRALVYNPRILILDEATSSVDSETEILIQDAIGKLMKGRTSIVIAHRLSTIRNADEILVLDKGKIVERGSHQQLIELQGAYYELLQKQQFVEV